jgi:murein DD-endopeptidase MepM/ murein hydrolase activator NlpD
MERRLLAALAASALLLALLPAPAAADTASDLAAEKARQEQLDQVRTQLGDQIATSLAASEELAKALQTNREQSEAMTGQLAAADAELAALEAREADLDASIVKTQAELDREKLHLRALARYLYTQPDALLVSLASSDSLGDLLTRVADVQSAGERVAIVKRRIESDADQLAGARKEVAANLDRQAALRAELAGRLDKLKEVAKAEEESQAKLADQVAKARDELARLDAQSSDLARQIAALLDQQQAQAVAAAMNAVWAQVQALAPPGRFAQSQGHSTKYRFIWPLPHGTVTQPFGPTDLAIEPAAAGSAHFHTGIDVADAIGTPVLAADDGIVLLVGTGNTGYGNFVILAHAGGVDTLYGHLASALVKAGDVVTQGTPVGLEGSTGNSTGPHCHFEVRIGNNPVDPAPMLPPAPPSDFRG